MRCSICEEQFDTAAPGVCLPFCSKRCKWIDRRRWLDEEYGLPYMEEDAADDEMEGKTDDRPSSDDTPATES